jgi:4-hydroxy-tetrahydrodipicolinate reductase
MLLTKKSYFQMLATIRHDSINRSGFMPGVLIGIRNVVKFPGLTIGLENYMGGIK